MTDVRDDPDRAGDAAGPGGTVGIALTEAHRRSWGVVVAATVRLTRDLDLAEDAAQDAFAEAVRTWPASGVPDRPEGWLVAAARRRAVDAIRRRATLRRKLPLLVDRDAEPGSGEGRDDNRIADDPGAVPVDERLRLIFLCCHPVLASESQVALTLRLVCGLTTAEIAAAFLVGEATMAARLTRAKRKIAIARIPLRVPTAEELPGRLGPVLDVAYLMITGGHAPNGGDSSHREDLLDRATELLRSLRHLLPGHAEIDGVLALTLLTRARSPTRTDDHGRVAPLEQQDRTRWDRAALDEAHMLIMAGLRAPGRPGRRLLQAAITAAQVRPRRVEDVDWAEVLTLYDALYEVWPSPVVALNRLVSLARVSGPEVALDALDLVEADPRLAGYRYRHVVRAELCTAAGRHADAARAYRSALAMAWNTPERDRLLDRLALVEDGPAD